MSVKLRSDSGYAFTGFATPFLSAGAVVYSSLQRFLNVDVILW